MVSCGLVPDFAALKSHSHVFKVGKIKYLLAIVYISFNAQLSKGILKIFTEKRKLGDGMNIFFQLNIVTLPVYLDIKTLKSVEPHH